MKKLLLILFLFAGFVASSQQLPGYTDINSRYRWLAGVFRALHIPAGSGPAALTAGQHTGAGAVYLDTLGLDAGVYYYINGVWVLQGQGAAADLPDEFIVKPSVSWKGSGYQFHIQEGLYRIDNNVYASDSGSVTLSASDPTDPRKDVIYVGTDGAFHVLEGTPSPAAAEPQLDGDQLKVTVIDVPAGSSVPALSQQMIYNENAEAWTESHTSVTTDPNSTTLPWIGSINFNVTNINHGDIIYFTKTLGTVSMLDYTAFSIAVKLKAILPTTANIRISFFASGIQVSNEISLNLNKNSLVYQAISVPTSSFTFSNYNINAVRIRYTNSAGATVHTGFYMDYIHLVAGFAQPGGGGGEFSATLSMPSGFQVSPATIANNGTWSVTGAGSTSQYIDGTGALRSFTAWHTQGAIDGVSKTAFGYGVSGNIFYQQYADATYPGLMSALLYRRVDTVINRAVTNLGAYDTVATYVDDFTTGFKSFKDSTGIGIIDRGDYLALYATGVGPGGGRFGVSGEDDAAGEDREFDMAGFNVLFQSESENTRFTIRRHRDGSGDYENEFWIDDNFVNIEAKTIGTVSRLKLGIDGVGLQNDNGIYTLTNLAEPSGSTNKMVIWDSVSNRLYVTAISGGPGGSSLFPTSGTGTATGSVIGDLDGNSLTVDAGSVLSALFISGAPNSEQSNLIASNATGDGNAASVSNSTTDTQAQSVLSASFNDGVKSAGVTLLADASSSSITHTADSHTLNGDVTINGETTGTGTNTSGSGINANGVFEIRRTITAAGNHRGFLDATYFYNNTVSTHSYAAFDVKDTIAVETGSTSDHQISFQARPLKVGGGTLTNMYNFGTATGKIDGGTVTNWYHYIAFNPTVSSGTITNQYGVYIPSLTAASNNYGAYFADNVGIGTNTPATKLHVAGSLRFVTGNQGANEFLVSDASGNADWTPGTSSLVGLGNVDNTSDATKNAATVTLTNKRITKRVTTIASSATPTPDGDASDVFTVTALAAGAVFAAPTGTPTGGQGLIIRIKDNGSSQTLGFNAIYRAGTDIALPTATTINKTMYLGFIWNATDSKWDLVSKTDGY